MRMPSNLEVRESRPSDYTAIASLLRQLGYELTPVLVLEKIEVMRHSRTDKVLVATVADIVVGCVSLHAVPLFHADGYIGRVTSLVVDECHRACGIGTALVAAAENWFMSVGCVKSEIASGDQRSRVGRFYELNGFAREGERFSKELSLERSLS
jgi:N-acetylglutamate synthase-like GNAT family acetyltransferase